LAIKKINTVPNQTSVMHTYRVSNWIYRYLSTSYQKGNRLANKNCPATRDSKNPTRGDGIRHFCYWWKSQVFFHFSNKSSCEV